MSANGSESPDDSFCADPSQQGLDATNTTNGTEAPSEAIPKPKRIACVLCRKRKLRCDGARPSCATCRRLSHDCAYDEVRKKSGPKRGYVKLLEQRLQQVETLLKNQDAADSSKDATRPDTASAYVASTIQQSLPNSGDYMNPGNRIQGPESRTPGSESLQNGGGGVAPGEQDFPWEMIGLGLEEPLPPQDVMDDLYQIYFNKIHPSLPIIHRPRFLAALNLAPQMRPPVCLRYAMWTMAASSTDKYEALQEHFYQRARKYAQMDEMKGHGESTITLAHCQTWILICTYEFKQMYFPRAWLSTGRGVRLAQMMQLHRLDGAGLDVKQCLPPPKDWTEREERRRTFWLAFCVDRYASIGTGWPMTIDERDIMTNLPSSEDAFERSKPMATGNLEQVLGPNGASNLQSLGGIVLTAAMFGRNLLHLHRPGPADNDDDINGGFWTRHRQIEQILLQTSLGLPDHLRLPGGLTDSNVVFTNMCIHTSSICLHQAAIFKADKYRLPVSVSNESKIRCVTAAAEIASIMRMISHMDLCAMNPFISFCVYVAARVFVQYLKTRPSDAHMTSSLHFLLQAMQALRRKNPLTESFLVQLDLDLESAGIAGVQPSAHKPSKNVSPQHLEAMRNLSKSVENSFSSLHDLPVEIVHADQHMSKPSLFPPDLDTVNCPPIFEIRETQNPAASNNTFATGTVPAATGNTPGPPFHMSSVNSVDLNSQPSGFPQSQSNQEFVVGFSFGDGNEMDTTSGDRSVDEPSPATMSSQSRGGSTSHSSYSPSQQTEHHLPYRASPKIPLNQMRAPVGTGGVSAFTNMSSAGEMYAGTFSASNNMPTTTFQQDFIMSTDWDYTAMNTSTGMTPMADAATWDSMLESVTMGWDSIGPPHGEGGPSPPQPNGARG